MRIKIRDDRIRDFLFEYAKNQTENSWKSLREYLDIPRASFDRYRNGKLLIPEVIFYNLLNFLEEPNRNKILADIEKLPDNFGAVLGGKKSYAINPDIFAKGRQKGIEAIKKKRDAENISFVGLRLSPEICEVVGAFIGDGCFNCYKNKLYQVEFAGDFRKDILYYNNTIIPVMKSVIPNLKPHIYRPNSEENGMRVVFYSKAFFHFLKDYFGFLPGKKAHTVSIPEKIILDDSFIRAAIRGIFDTDGTVFLDRRAAYKFPYPRISLQIVSKSLYDQLCLYLSKYFNLYKGFNAKREVYIIEIYGIAQVRRWMSLIGFSNKRHLDKIALVAQW